MKRGAKLILSLRLFRGILTKCNSLWLYKVVAILLVISQQRRNHSISCFFLCKVVTFLLDISL